MKIKLEPLHVAGLIIFFLLSGGFCLASGKLSERKTFNKLYDYLNRDDFFRAKVLYDSVGKRLSGENKLFVEAVLDNAFNKLEESENKINELLKRKRFPDSLKYKLYSIRTDNAVKLFRYKEASDAIAVILKNYREYPNKEELKDYENSLKLLTALKDVPAQRIFIKDNSAMNTRKDKYGLNTLNVSFGEDSLNMVFDTGANLSTTSVSTATRLNMKIINAEINVGSSTSQKIFAKLAVCNKFTLGNIDVYNTVFLVVPDSLLIFPKQNYQIYGILGFPVMRALKEIKITSGGEFIVPEEESGFTGNSNLAMSGLRILIDVDGRPYCFDSGADHTQLYYNFYIENKNEIEKNYKLEKFKSGGVAGIEEYTGYLIDHTFNVSGKEVTLNGIQLLTKKIHHDESSYGNIGHDLISKFNSMTLNLHKMFIKFE